jgi:hypothetical protein
MRFQLVITVAASAQAAANRIAAALGWGPNNFTIQTALVIAPQTLSHVGRIVGADPAHAAVIEAAVSGTVPEDPRLKAMLSAAMGLVNPADLAAIRDSCEITLIPPDQATKHSVDYDAHCTAHGLTRLVVEDEI